MPEPYSGSLSGVTAPQARFSFLVFQASVRVLDVPVVASLQQPSAATQTAEALRAPSATGSP